MKEILEKAVLILPILFLAYGLWKNKITVQKFSAFAVTWVFLFFIYFIPLDSISEISALGVQIKIAQETIKKTKEATKEASETIERLAEVIKRLEELEGKAEKTTLNMSNLERLLKLRPWAMTLPNGGLASTPYGGLITYTNNPSAKLADEIFTKKENKWVFKCDYKKIDILIIELPNLPYAAAAKAKCLKQKGDLKWRENPDKIRKQFKDLTSIEPHVIELDNFSQQYEDLFKKIDPKLEKLF